MLDVVEIFWNVSIKILLACFCFCVFDNNNYNLIVKTGRQKMSSSLIEHIEK